MPNYSSNKGDPRKKGKLSDVVKPKKKLFTRVSAKDKLETIAELQSDLVVMFTDLGIVLSNTNTMARSLVAKGWIKVKKIEKDTL